MEAVNIHNVNINGDETEMKEIFNKIIAKAGLRLLKELNADLESSIVKKVNELKSITKTVDISNFVTHEESFIPDTDDYNNLLKELESIQLKKQWNGVETAWLTTTNQAYNWSSSQGEVENSPKDINDYCSITNIMDKLNKDFNLKLNSCLVSYYPDERVNQRLHADNEPTLDHSQPIYIVSVGAQRPIQFYRKHQHHTEEPHLVIDLKPGSLCGMLPDCQHHFKHRIPPGTEQGFRFSLSFRCRRSQEHPRTPVKEMVAIFEEDNIHTSPKGNEKSPIPVSQSYPPQHTTTPLTSVIFGTSITTKLDPKRLAQGNRKCINKSVSGATIASITKSMEQFFEDTSTNSLDIGKVIFSLGTNDIRFRKGVYYLKNQIVDLIHKTKMFFPQAKIYFQSVLPIKITKYFHASNFVNFNKLLWELCKAEKCSFIDIFREFVDSRGYDYNIFMYRNDGVHLNHRGTVRLAYHMRYVINRHTFNPRVY